MRKIIDFCNENWSLMFLLAILINSFRVSIVSIRLSNHIDNHKQNDGETG